MSLTTQQQSVVDYITSTKAPTLTLVNAVAGAGKTHLLVEIAKTLNPKVGLYVAYNKSIATEASRKFPRTVDCKTTHSLAYANTVKPFKLKLGTFSYRNILEKVSYDIKCEVVDNVREFCLSKFLDFDSYAEDRLLTPTVSNLCNKYLDLMQQGKTECTHDFYLKLFHILLVEGDIEFEPIDLLLLDESGDLNEVTLEIFLNLPAQHKVAVGDKYQNIYTFNHTINAFKVLEGQGKEFQLSQSFRVSNAIASRIETFCKAYLDPSMVFKGIDYKDTTITSRAFIARTNSSLIDKMIELNNLQTPYALVRSSTDIFRTALMVCGLSYQGKILNKEYKHLQADLDDWYEKPDLKLVFKSPLAYLSDLHINDIALVSAIRLVGKHGKPLIMSTYKTAKSHEKYDCNYTLATAHSVKGLEFDEVIAAEDMNTSIDDIVANLKEDKNYPLSTSETESLNLYYVMASRAKKSLINARHL